MSDVSYNGWANYPTWCVNMWLSNDQGTYDGTLIRAQAVHAETEPRSEYWTLGQSHCYELADTLKAWVTLDLAPDLGASFAADLLGWALEQVDWQEIAQAWLDTVDEEAQF